MNKFLKREVSQFGLFCLFCFFTWIVFFVNLATAFGRCN